jgi:hypothetical protein
MFVPKCTAEMCEIEVSRHGIDLLYVPKDMCTYDLCMIAVKQDPDAIKYVPNKFFCFEICVHGTFKFIPKRYRIPKLCKHVFAINSDNIRYVPKKYRTKEMCMTVFDKNVFNIKYIPEHMLTAEIFYDAVIRSKESIYVPWKYRTPKICGHMVKKCVYKLSDIPLLTEDMLFDLIKMERINLLYDDLSSLTSDMFCVAVRYEPRVVMRYTFSTNMLIRFVGITSKVLEYMNCITNEVMMAAVKHDGNAIRYVPPASIDNTMIRLAIKNGACIENIADRSKITYELCMLTYQKST